MAGSGFGIFGIKTGVVISGLLTVLALVTGKVEFISDDLTKTSLSNNKLTVFLENQYNLDESQKLILKAAISNSFVRFNSDILRLNQRISSMPDSTMHLKIRQLKEIGLINHCYKLLVVDIDGTLLGKDGNILPEDREALARACDLGIKVSLSTGRAAQACLSLISQLALDSYHTFFEGALVSNPADNKEVYVQPLSQAVVKQAVEFAHFHNIDLELYSATHYFAERETWSTNAHSQFFGIQATIVDFTTLWEQETIIKGGLVVTTPQEAARARSFCLQFDDRLHFTWVRTPAYPGVVLKCSVN